ncbi:hypothetical protein ACROYT_G001146 [Oculina patagonica]
MWQVNYGLFHRRKIRKITCFLLMALAIVGFLDMRLNRCGSWSSTSIYHTNELPDNLFTHLELTASIPYVNDESLREPFRHRTALITTTACEQYYFLLILVSSAPDNFERRDYIRSTWAVDNVKPARWKTAFLVAQTLVQNDSNLLLTENEVHADLIRADYYDHYWNQTLKLLMGFEWAARYCNFSFLLKVDDDVFVNFPKLIFFLNDSAVPNEKLYMGNAIRSPCASRQGKWQIYKEEYNEERYPDYCSGFGFILSHDVVALFVEVFDLVPNFRIDDVYIGMLAHKTGIQAVHNDGFVSSCESHTPIARTLVRHGSLKYCGDDVTANM